MDSRCIITHSDQDGGAGCGGGRRRKNEDLISSSERGSGLTLNAKCKGSAIAANCEEIVEHALSWR